MAFYRTYIQQLEYNGTAYTKGSFVDLYEAFGLGVEKFPFKKYPETKDLPSRDWKDEHGLDTYIPSSGLILKDYDLEVEIVCYGSASTLQTRLQSFFSYISGYNTNGSARLAIYDEHVSQGRKDVRYVSNENVLWFNEDCDDESIARFKVKFHVDDPKTAVVPAYNSGGTATQLNWS